MLCVLKFGVCWSLSFSLFPLSYLCGVLYNMIVHALKYCRVILNKHVVVKEDQTFLVMSTCSTCGEVGM